MAVGRYAQVHEATGFVVNVILLDPEAQPGVVAPAGYKFVEDVKSEAGPGFTWDGAAFVAPPSPETIPEV